MPALKAKSGTTISKEAECLHVAHKSGKISKNSSSAVRVFPGSVELDNSFKNWENGNLLSNYFILSQVLLRSVLLV